MLDMLQVIPRLNEILKEREMTQIQLSKITGIPQGTISKFDRNRQHMDLHLVLISRKLNIPIEELFKVHEVLQDIAPNDNYE
jgi:transcriptional regulator with XRE-family HTH domain